MNRHVFTYGSLMFAPVWTRVVTGRYRDICGTLDGHRRFAVRDQDYPGIIEADGARVDGVLYLDVDGADLVRLDRFEGDEYRRGAVTVACADGVLREAETYLYLPHDRLRDVPWEPGAFALDRFLATYCQDRLGPPA